MIAKVPEVEIEVAKLNNEGEASSDTEVVRVRLDNLMLCNLEQKFGSLEKFAESVKSRPLSATIDLLSAVCGWRTAEAKQRLLPGSAMRIIQDIFAAYMEAIGGEAVEQGPLAEGGKLPAQAVAS